jgi:DNA-binding transcriptional LysR family regulator
MPERTIELGSYHAMLGCVVAGMGIALLPKSVLSTFPESKRLNVQKLAAGESRFDIVLIWRRGGGSAKVQAMCDLLAAKRRK